VRRRGTVSWPRGSTSPPLMHGEFPWWWSSSLRWLNSTTEIEVAPLEWEGERGRRRCVIRLKRIYNFWCSMLVFTPFALCFVTLRGFFMWFPKLTYWQDATVPVPCFLLFLCFIKAT
jgi:hypothetical protein